MRHQAPSWQRPSDLRRSRVSERGLKTQEFGAEEPSHPPLSREVWIDAAANPSQRFGLEATLTPAQ
jgi:hypothetical protein